MATYIYYYICSNWACRNITILSGVRQSVITCDCCGWQMHFLKEEKTD